MNSNVQNSIPWLLLTIAWLGVICSSTCGQVVTAGISSREAWVGSPIVFQLQISNAKDYKIPEVFEIDGCDVRSAGAPSRSSQITIFNGRRSESHTITQNYLITPRREGTFEIPQLEVTIDGQTKKTSSGTFVATKSETGDLLFVEVVGKKESVFVGEPLDLKLKIWVKPFVVRDQRIKLNESDMWQMFSRHTSWGPFSDRLQELAENRQRPSGESVLRKDETGNEREYYLYEVDATVYPTKPGNIDASDLQVVVNYPTELGRRNDRIINDFFNGGAAGANSLIKDMMNDDFFASPFGRRLTISKSRPIVAEAKVASTKVVPVPTENQPFDYQGAVGRYRIFTEAEPKNVAEGDPVTLRIGLVGDGPMELVQAPPLSELQSLTSDFQVADQSLAGFVQNDTKVFVTTVRPNDLNVKQIPPIPFTFFDPEKKAYATVYSKPIDIEVEKSESLLLDAIVSGAGVVVSPGSDSGSSSNEKKSSTSREFDFGNDYSTSVLLSESPSKKSWWWYFAVFPPIAMLIATAAKFFWTARDKVFSLRPAQKIALSQIKRADNSQQLEEILRTYVERCSNVDCPTMAHAVGQVRELNAYEGASRLESFCNRLNENNIAGSLQDAGDQTPERLADLKSETASMIELLEQTFRKRKLRGRRLPTASRKRSTGTVASTLFIALALTGVESTSVAANRTLLPAPTQTANLSAELETIFDEANQAYERGLKEKKSAPGQAKEAFLIAGQKYQTLVDQGVRSSNLFCNLANAFNQSGDRKRAILNYHRALWLNPNHSKARQNLDLLESRLAEVRGSADYDAANAFSASMSKWRSVCLMLNRLIGNRNLQFVFGASSVLFWLLIGMKLFRRSVPLLRWAMIPLILLLISGVILYQFESNSTNSAIVMSDAIKIKSGDGTEFPTVQKLESVAGRKVEILVQRDSWIKVRTFDGTEGWLPAQDLATVQM